MLSSSAELAGPRQGSTGAHRQLTGQILGGLVLGVAVGCALNVWGGAATGRIVEVLDVVTATFLRLVKMVIAPLVLATLVTGAAQMRDGAAANRLLMRAIGWFFVASLISLGLGLLIVDLLQPGHGVGLAVAATDAGPAAVGFRLGAFMEHVVPTSVVRAMADNEVLQIVVFSLFAGAGLAAIGEAGRPILRGLESLAALMLRITGYVMRFAPLAVFAAVAGVIAVRGLEIISTFARFVATFYLGLATLWLVLLAVGAAALGTRQMRRLAGEIREPFLIAFATASSEASYPRMLDALERFGVRPRIASFVLPLGYAFNLDGSMMYCAFASMFIAQAYGVDLSVAQQIAMLLLLMVTSKGIAGVPRASLVVIAATLPYFDIPAAGLALIVAVDHFLDMGRTATNVIGNAVAIAVLDRWEPAEADAPAELSASDPLPILSRSGTGNPR
ncbi:MAG: dicarboxylate/amino acid:cation symporter [Phenylobacterium sp.]